MLIRFVCMALLLLMFQNECFSQNSDSLKNEITLYGLYSFNSNCITTQFANHFYSGKYISDEIKNNAKKQLKYINRFGSDFDKGMLYCRNFDSLFNLKNISVQWGYQNRQHVNMAFSKDFFNFFFYGNKSYAGSPADLGNFSYNNIHYHQFSCEVTFFGDSTKRNFGAQLSLLALQQLTSVKAETANVYTAADGTYLDIHLNMKSVKTNPHKNNRNYLNGSGISTGFFYETPYMTRYNDGVLKFEVQDLGFLYLNKNSSIGKVDTFYTYNGISLSNIFNIDENSLPTLSADSFLNNNLIQNNQNVFYFLPAIFSVNASTYYAEKFIIEKGISFRANANCKPLYYLGLSYIHKKKTTATLTLSYGGYGKFNAGFELDWILKNNFHLKIDSYYLTGYIFTKTFNSQGLGIILSKVF